MVQRFVLKGPVGRDIYYQKICVNGTMGKGQCSSILSNVLHLNLKGSQGRDTVHLSCQKICVKGDPKQRSITGHVDRNEIKQKT